MRLDSVSERVIGSVCAAVGAVGIAAILGHLLTSIPPREETKPTYIETNRGLTAAGTMHCLLGLLVTSDGRNILDENSKPITCSGYVKLTKAEAAKWGTK